MKHVLAAIALLATQLLRAFPGDAPASRFGMNMNESIMVESDLGILNGALTTNGLMHDVAAVSGLYAPPYYSNTFRLELRFNGRRMKAETCFWQPEEVARRGSFDGVAVETELVLAANRRGAILKCTLVNTSRVLQKVALQYEISGAPAFLQKWGFHRPVDAPRGAIEWRRDAVFSFNHDAAIGVASTLPLKPAAKEIFDADAIELAPGGTRCFYTIIVLDQTERAVELLGQLRRDPEKAIAQSRANWAARVAKLDAAMPHFSTDFLPLQRLYDRSLLHFLLNEWQVPEWKLHPYYPTGGLNGGCFCCYLWNYGEPYRLWSMLAPVSAREHLKCFLALDLTKCYSFYPDDASRCGPYYPVNQEKILLLTHAYVLQTRDVAFLHRKIGDRRVIDILIEAATMHDDLAKEAVLVDYGTGNHHLELRGKERYDGIAPDLNLRRAVNYHLAAQLCRLAKVTPPVDFEQRAAALKAKIEKELYSPQDQWFYAIDPAGKLYLRYTMQMFKALGWSDWALTNVTREALISHLNEAEFLGAYGMHSMAKQDPAYDPADVDNGGPGCCVSFAPAVADRLFRDGYGDKAWDVFRRLLWLADALPYWGDSQTADRMEYRRDTPLQSDIQSTSLAQTIIFGLFGIDVKEDFSIEIAPYLPPEAATMKLENIHLAGKHFSIFVDRQQFEVEIDGKKNSAPLGQRLVIRGETGK